MQHINGLDCTTIISGIKIEKKIGKNIASGNQ